MLQQTLLQPQSCNAGKRVRFNTIVETPLVLAVSVCGHVVVLRLPAKPSAGFAPITSGAPRIIMPFPSFTKKELLHDTPSRKDGIDAEKESSFRKTYCKLIADAGKALKLPQWAIATATLFCHRYYAVRSMKRNDRFLVSTACLFLAGKVEDSPRNLNHVITTTYQLRCKRDPQARNKLKDQVFFDKLREQVLFAETMVLYAMGFDLNVRHPYNDVIKYLKELRFLQPSPEPHHRNMSQAIWNFINDSLRTTLGLQYNHDQIAKGALYLAEKLMKTKLPIPDNQPFTEYFKIDQATLDDITAQLMELYEQIPKGGQKTTSGPAGLGADDVANNAAASAVADGGILGPPASDLGEAPLDLPAKAEVAVKEEDMIVKVEKVETKSCKQEMLLGPDRGASTADIMTSVAMLTDDQPKVDMESQDCILDVKKEHMHESSAKRPFDERLFDEPASKVARVS